MRTTQQLSITLPLEMARMVKDKVASGAYATESEVVREGIRALQERDAVVERWLSDEVAPSYDAHKAHPKQTKSLVDVAKDMGEFMDVVDQ
jgi:antitoxin ParD1/3/4